MGFTRIHIFISRTASLKPCQKVWCFESTQSSSPMSSSRRQTASWRSLSVSQLVVRGKLGRTKYAPNAMKIVITPSIMKSQRQARRPRAPSNPFVMPADIKPENAPERRDPEYRRAVLKPNSFLVYHEERKKRQPGKYAASTNPRKNRMAIKPL